MSVQMDIPELQLICPADGRKEWSATIRRWRDTGDEATLGTYAQLAKSGRFHIFKTEHTSYGWPECHTALHLQSQGWRCWTGAQLFPFKKREVKSEVKKRITGEVVAALARSGLVLPNQDCVDFVPKNPDLVCFHPGRQAWRFCEVKRDEEIQEAQLQALGLLHLLLRAEVAIVRLVPDGAERRRRRHKARFRFTGVLRPDASTSEVAR